MAWFELPDGWRDESMEGPYTETLQTKYDNSTGKSWKISRLYNFSNQPDTDSHKLFKLEYNHQLVNMYPTLAEAKTMADTMDVTPYLNPQGVFSC